MSNFKTGASCASENAAGNVNYQCLGVLNMDTICHNKFEPPKDDGQPLLDGVGQHGSGRGNANGQNGNDSSKATDGSSNRQQGIGSSSKDTSEAHANAPNTHEANARDHGPKGTNKQSYASFFQNNRVPSEASKLTYIAPPLGKLVLGIEEID